MKATPYGLTPEAWRLVCKFHTWQMNDGRWHSSPMTNTGPLPLSHMDIPGCNTRREAEDALRRWATRAAEQIAEAATDMID